MRRGMVVKLAAIALVCGVGLVLSANAAQANLVTLNGSTWLNQPISVSQNASLPTPATPPDLTFTVTSSVDLLFSSCGPLTAGGQCTLPATTSYTVGTWLATPPVFPNTQVVGSFASPSGFGVPAAMANTVDNSYWDFTGTVNVTNGEMFTVNHDDGAEFLVNGVAIPGISGGPTSPQQSIITYTGPTLNGASIQLIYTECCGAPAVFETNLPNGGLTTTPEPASVALVGSGLIGLVGFTRRRFKV